MEVVSLVVMIALLVATGALCSRTGVITREAERGMSGFVLSVVSPAVILVSYQREFEARLLHGLGLTLLLSFLSYALAMVLAAFFVRSRDNLACSIERFSCIYSNCAFMGIPLIQAVYGSEGVFFLTAFITSFHLLVWTHGILLFQGEFDARGLLRALRSPPLLAVFAGLALFLLGLSLPTVLCQTLDSLAALNTPLAMVVAGASIARTDLKAMFRSRRLYYLSFLKLILIPAACLLLFRLFPIDPVIAGTVILAVACPTAAIGTLFSVRFQRDEALASQIFAMTTALSVITLPLFLLLGGLA